MDNPPGNMNSPRSEISGINFRQAEINSIRSEISGIGSTSNPSALLISESLNELQKKIAGQRSTELSPIELKRLFDTPVTPEINVTLFQGLTQRAIPVDTALLQAISRATTRSYLIPIGMCLRANANPNMYVNVPKLGEVHILGYVYYVLHQRFNLDLGLADDSIAHSIALMLVYAGARPMMPMFKRPAGNIPTTAENIPTSTLTVTEWLFSEGIPTILNQVSTGDANNLAQITIENPKVIPLLALILDAPSLLNNTVPGTERYREFSPEDWSLAIQAFSLKSMDKIPFLETRVMMDAQMVIESVTYFNAPAFEYLLSRGMEPSYLILNRILISLKDARERGYTIVIQELEKMLLQAIAVGAELDPDQMNIISTFGQNILEAVNRDYAQPYWRKICRGCSAPVSNACSSLKGSGVPERLRSLAISLNIDPGMSHRAICEAIGSLSRLDKDGLKEAARRRQQIRIAGDLGTIAEFVGGRTPLIPIRNLTLLPKDPMEYNDIDVAWYRDEQGAVWCFGSDMFDSLLETKLNPYNSIYLPESFLDQLRYRKRLLDRVERGSNDENTRWTAKIPITFSEAVDSLTAKDTISGDSGERAMREFLQVATANNISSDTILNLTKAGLMSALRAINYSVDLNPLTISHARLTVARIISYLRRADPQSLPIFFSSISVGLGSMYR